MFQFGAQNNANINSSSAGMRFCGKFIDDLSFGFHSFQPIGDADSQTNVPFTDKVNVFNVSQKFVLDDPDVRTLVAESNSIFYNLQNLRKKSSENYLMTSRAYRSAIRTMLNKLQERIEDEMTAGDSKVFHEMLVTIFYSVECLWHLMEICLIDQTSMSVVPGLLEWTKFHFPAASHEAGEMLINMERDVDMSRETYWRTVRTLVLQGQVDTARALLKLSSSSDTMTFQLAEKDLSSMPVFNSLHSGVSMQKFRSQFSYWSSALVTRIDAGLYSTEPDLEEIMKLITGDKSAWQQICKNSECWYEYFAGYLFFNHPVARYFELGSFVDSWLSQWVSVRGGSNYALLKHLERTILAIMKNDIVDCISLIQNIADNKWFVVHLVDLLVHSNQIRLTDDETNNKTSKSMRESFITDYGIMLMSQGNMWQIGYEYLEFSSSEALGIREMLLTRIPIKTDEHATKMISFCRHAGLHLVEQEICKIMYNRAISLKRFGNAMEWAIRSRDNVHVTKITNIYLQHYCKTGEMMHKNLLSQLGSKMLMFGTPRLLFLIKYYDFHMLYSSRQFSQAAELIIGLLCSNIVPNFFWPTLMVDVIPLLEYHDPIIPSKETFIIMEHIENDLIPALDEVGKSINSEQTEGLNMINGCPNELVQLLRLACTRNLSRALMIENTL